MKSSIDGPASVPVSGIAYRLAASVVVLVAAAAAAYAGLVLLAVAGCLALADDSTLGLSDKALGYCGLGGSSGATSLGAMAYYVLTVGLPCVACSVRAVVLVWRGRSIAALGWSAAVFLPWFVFMMVLRSPPLQVFLPNP